MAVHLRVSAREQRLWICRRIALDDNADAGPHREHLTADGHRSRDGSAEASSERSGDPLVREVLAEHDEFVAGVARDRVTFADLPLQTLRDADQQLVANAVAVFVVDLLEAVEVDEDHPHCGVLAAAARERDGEAVKQQLAIGQLRQRVVQRAMLELASCTQLLWSTHPRSWGGAFAKPERGDLHRERTAIEPRDLDLAGLVRLFERFAESSFKCVRIDDDAGQCPYHGG